MSDTTSHIQIDAQFILLCLLVLFASCLGVETPLCCTVYVKLKQKMTRKRGPYKTYVLENVTESKIPRRSELYYDSKTQVNIILKFFSMQQYVPLNDLLTYQIDFAMSFADRGASDNRSKKSKDVGMQ